MSTLIFIAPWLSVVVQNFRSAEVFWVGASMSQPAIFARAKADHEGGKSRHCPRLVLGDLARKPFVPNTMFERGYNFGVWDIYYLVLFGQKPIPKLPG